MSLSADLRDKSVDLRDRSVAANRRFHRPGDLIRLLIGLLLITLLVAVNAAADEACCGSPAESYNAMLGEHVNDRGLIDYPGLAESDALTKVLKPFVQAMGSASADTGDHDASLARLINLYNASVLMVLLENGAGTTGGVDSILKVDGGEVFNKPRVELDGKTISLNELEKMHVAPLAGDARYHFAVNCGAYSCPPLRNEAYTGERVQQQLDEQRANSLSTDAPRFLRWEGNGAVEATKLMDWYGKEFGDPATYLNEHAKLPGKVTQVMFLEYDWSLNAQR